METIIELGQYTGFFFLLSPCKNDRGENHALEVLEQVPEYLCS